MKIIGTVLGYLQGILETGNGFLLTLMGFIIVRFFYSIPVYLIWGMVVVKIFAVPPISFFAWWAMLTAFDCVRFDITRLYAPINNYEEEN